MTDLVETLASVAALDDADLVVDLSRVTFIDAATLGALIRCRNLLEGLSRTLTLRAPSRYARRVIGTCGLVDIVDPSTAAWLHITSSSGSGG